MERLLAMKTLWESRTPPTPLLLSEMSLTADVSGHIVDVASSYISVNISCAEIITTIT